MSDWPITVTSLTGTTNQVVVSSPSGNITLSLPQSINTGATPQFARLGLGVAADASAPLNINTFLINSDGTRTAWGGSIDNNVLFSIKPPGTFTVPAANDGYGIYYFATLISAVNQSAFGFMVNPVIGKAASGTHPNLAALQVQASFSAGASLVTNAYAVFIPTFSAPASTTNASGITVSAPTGASNNYAINVLSGSITTAGLIARYNNIATVAWGVPAIYGSGRVIAQTGAAASVATYTVGAADGSFIVSANVNVTASTLHNFTTTATYTDETNTSRVLTLSFSQLTGVILTAITNTQGVGAYEGIRLHIRCKASTAITIATTGTFTNVTYNVEGNITQIG